MSEAALWAEDVDSNRMFWLRFREALGRYVCEGGDFEAGGVADGIRAEGGTYVGGATYGGGDGGDGR